MPENYLDAIKSDIESAFSEYQNENTGAFELPDAFDLDGEEIGAENWNNLTDLNFIESNFELPEGVNPAGFVVRIPDQLEESSENSNSPISSFSPETTENSNSPKFSKYFSDNEETETSFNLQPEFESKPEITSKPVISDMKVLSKSEVNEPAESIDSESFEQPVPLDIKIECSQTEMNAEIDTSNLSVYEDVSADESDVLQSESEIESSKRLEPVPEICLASGLYQQELKTGVSAGFIVKNQVASGRKSAELKVEKDVLEGESQIVHVTEGEYIESEIESVAMKVEPEEPEIPENEELATSELPSTEDVVEIEVSDLPIEPYVKFEMDLADDLPILPLEPEIQEVAHKNAKVLIEPVVKLVRVKTFELAEPEPRTMGAKSKLPNSKVNSFVSEKDYKENVCFAASELIETNQALTEPVSDLSEPETDLSKAGLSSDKAEISSRKSSVEYSEFEDDIKMEVDSIETEINDFIESEHNSVSRDINSKINADEKIDSGFSTSETDFFEERFTFEDFKSEEPKAKRRRFFSKWSICEEDQRNWTKVIFFQFNFWRMFNLNLK